MEAARSPSKAIGRRSDTFSKPVRSAILKRTVRRTRTADERSEKAGPAKSGDERGFQVHGGEGCRQPAEAALNDIESGVFPLGVVGSRVDGDLDEASVGVATIVRDHLAEGTQFGHGPVEHLDPTVLQVLTDSSG